MDLFDLILEVAKEKRRSEELMDAVCKSTREEVAEASAKLTKFSGDLASVGQFFGKAVVLSKVNEIRGGK